MKRELYEKRIGLHRVWLFIVPLILIWLTGGTVNAENYVYPIEKTKELQVLDGNYRDKQGARYSLNEENHTAVVGVTNSQNMNTSEYHGANDGICVIPEQVSYQGTVYTVTQIASNAFRQNKYLKTLVIADTVKELGALAIHSSFIEYLYIGSGMTQIVNAANDLAGCSYITDITVSSDNASYMTQEGILFTKDQKTLLYAPRLLQGNSLTTYAIPSGVETIGSQAFSKTRYRRILLPESVKKIENDAFEDGYLTEMDLQNVENVGAFAFAGCKYLRYVRWPEAVNKVSLARAIFGGDGENNIQYMYHTKNLAYARYDHSAVLHLSNLKMLVVEEGTTTIGKGEYAYSELETVILPEGLKKIEANAFCQDPKLQRVYIPASVTQIGDKAFSDNDMVIYGIAGSVAETYATANEIKFVDVSDHDHTNLSEVAVYEDSYRRITAKYCAECGYGTDIRETNKEMTGVIDGTYGAYDFELAKTKRKVTLDSELKDDQGVMYTLYEDSDAAYVSRIPDSPTIRHITIPEVVIYNGREYIVTTLFGSISSSYIESIALPDTLWQIYESAFDSYSLKYIYLGEGVGNASKGMFMNKQGITGIWVAPGNTKYYVKDKVLYYKDGTVLCDYSDKEDDSKTTEKDTGTQQPSEDKTTDRSTEHGTERPADNEKSTQVSTDQTVSEKTTQVSTDQSAAEKTTQVIKEQPAKTETTTEKTASKKKKILKRPKLRVKKKKLSSGTHYLQLTLGQTEGTYIELQVRKSKKKYKKVKLVSSRLKYYKGKMRIGYKPDGKKMWLRIRTYKKKKGKKYYSEWSTPVMVK